MGIDVTVTPRKVLVSDHGKDTYLGGTIASTAVDAGSSPTSTLRKGLVMAKLTASEKYAEYDDAQTDGREVAVGILADTVDLTEGSADGATPIDQPKALLIVHGVVDESELIGIDAAAKVDLGDAIQYR